MVDDSLSNTDTIRFIDSLVNFDTMSYNDYTNIRKVFPDYSSGNTISLLGA